jgi:transcriptional/translational regulatory protein YebC/TACO1
MTVVEADLVMVPTSTVAVGDVEGAKKVLRLVDSLDDHDDVQNVYANFDITDELLLEASA